MSGEGALLVVHGPVRFVASKRVPLGQLNVRLPLVRWMVRVTFGTNEGLNNICTWVGLSG